MREFKDLKIAVAGTGYVGLSIATLLSQHHKVTAVDIIPEKVELINNKKSPIQDEYIEKFLAEKELDLTATLLAFAMSMDDVVISIFVTGPRVSTLPIKVYTQMKTGVTPEINALCTIMLGVILLVLAVYLIAGKRGKGNIKDEQ